MNNKTMPIKRFVTLFWLFLIFLSSPTQAQITMDEFIGVNVRRSDPIEKFTPVGTIREYHDWVLDEGFYPNNSLGYPNNKYKWNPSYAGQSFGINFDDWYKELDNQGYTISPCILNSPPYIIDQSIQSCAPLPNGGGNPCGILEQKPIFNFSNYNSIGLPSPFDNILTTNDNDPYAYTAHSDLLYHFTARYGSQPQSAYSNAEWNNITNKLHSSEAQEVGLGRIRYIEHFNEPDKYWHITEDGYYYEPSEFAAMLSADYDGHMDEINNTIQNQTGSPMPVGVLGADPNIKMVMAGLTDLDWNYTEDMLDWFNQNRTNSNYRTYPFHVFNYHRYSTKMYKSTLPVHGFSPEEDIFSIEGGASKSMKYHMIDLVNNIDNYITSNNAQSELGDREIWLTEFGYDTSPLSRYGAIPNVTLDEPIIASTGCKVENLRADFLSCLLPSWKYFSAADQAKVLNIIYETQGQWLTRSLLEFSSTGFDRAFIYDIRDSSPEQYCLEDQNGFCQYAGNYAYSGLLESQDNNPSFEQKPSWYYVSTVKNVLNGYQFSNDDLTECDPEGDPVFATNCEKQCPRIYEYGDGQGGQIFAFWSPTSCHIDEYPFTITLPNGTTDVTIVTMQDGNPDGISQGFSGITNNQIEVMVSEYPKFLIIGESITSCSVDPVTNLNAESTSCNTVKLTWTAPITTNCQVDHYELYYKKASEVSDVNNVSIGELEYYQYFNAISSVEEAYISGLESGTCYYFFVVPVSVDGVSSPLSYSSTATFATEELCFIDISQNMIGGLPSQYSDEALSLFEYGSSTCPSCDYIQDQITYSNTWNDILTNSNISVNSFEVDFGEQYELHSLFLNDGAGTGAFEVEYSTTTANNWQPYFTYTPTVLFDHWIYLSNMVASNTSIRKLRFTFVDANSRINKIMICGTPISSGDVAGCVGDAEFLCNEDASFEVDVCSNNSIHTLVLNSISGETGDWQIGNTSYSNTASLTHIISDPNFQLSSVDISFTINNPCIIQCEETISLPQIDLPSADFDFDQTLCNPVITFYSVNNNWNHEWSFEESTGNVLETSQEPNPTFNFVNTGSYTVVHTVSNACGLITETLQNLIIEECPQECNCNGDFIPINGNTFLSNSDLMTYWYYTDNQGLQYFDLEGKCIEVDGTLNINLNAFFLGGTFSFKKDSEIRVKGGIEFRISKNAHLKGCNEMWRGIYAEPTAKILIGFPSYTGFRPLIEDALHGVVAINSETCVVNRTDFNNNFISILTVGQQKLSLIKDINISGNTFMPNNSTLSSPIPPLSGIEIPEIGDEPYAGIFTSGSSFLLTFGCDIQDQANGMVIHNSNNVFLRGNVITNINENSIYDPDNDSTNPPNGTDNIVDGYGVFAIGTGSQFLKVESILETPPIAQPPQPGTPYQPSIFTNATIGVYSKDVNIDLGDCQMSQVDEGIHIEMGANNSIDIDGNTISANKKAILLNNPNQPNLNIQNNYLETGLNNNNPNTALAGIDLQMVMGNENVSASIENNDIHVFGGASGIFDSHYGIRSSASSHIDIAENTITLHNENNNQQNGRVGIYVRASNEFLVGCNTISGVATSNWWANGSSKGMIISNTDNSDYSCNILSTLGQGMEFQMGCANSQILTNEFDVFDTGLQFGDDQNIPAMLGVQERNGNIWTESTPVAARYNNFDQNSLIANRFEIHTTNSCGDGNPDFFPSCPNTIQVTNGSPFNWFVFEPGSFDECTMSGTTCNYPTPLLPPDDENTELDDAIKNEQTFSNVYNEELTWQLQRTLFQKLDTNSDLLLDASSNDFYNEKVGEAIGQLAQVNNNVSNVYELSSGTANNLQQWRNQIQTLNSEIISIDQALVNSSGQDSINLENQKAGLFTDLQGVLVNHQSAITNIRQQQLSSISNTSQNDNIIATHIYEINEQVVNDIWVSTIALGNKDFTSSQVKQLADIGRQCFIDGGYIPVSKARAMLLLIGLEVTDDECNSKEDKGERREENNEEVNVGNNKFLISPNPTRDDLELKYDFEYLTSTHQVIIFDITGKRLANYSLEDQSGILRINTDNFTAGIYWLSIVEDQSGQNIYSEKIIIQK